MFRFCVGNKAARAILPPFTFPQLCNGRRRHPYCSAFSNNKRPPWTSGLAWRGSMGVRRPGQSRRQNSPGSTDSNFP